MKPLLKISSVPIKIETTTTRAALKQSTEQPKVNITRQKGRANIQTTPAKVYIDQTEAKASAGLRNTQRMISDAAQEGMMAAREATRTYAENGNAMIDSHGKGNPIADVASTKIGRMVDTAMAFIPTTGPEISAEPSSISFDYQMDKLTFDWNVNTKPQLEFVPPTIEFTVAQYPELIIEYVGEPIYVPASSNPNYQGNA